MDAECEDNCGSRSFHIGEDGFTYCSEGHRQLHTGLVTAAEDEQPRVGRRTIRQSQDDTEAVLTGGSGLEHYLICFQLLLWKQVHSVVADGTFPAELGVIVRDLWILKLNGLRSRLSKDTHDDEIRAKVFSSQQQDSDQKSASVTDKFRQHRGASGLPRIIDGITLIYAGLMLLRLPVMAQDLFDRIQNGQLLYYRAIQRLDKGMRARLAALYHGLIDPYQLLRFELLSDEITSTLSILNKEFGVAVPALNHNLCLWRAVAHFGLPAEIFAAALRLTRLLSIRYEHTATEYAKTLKTPEKRWIALLIVATKLLYPFDGRERTPKRPVDPSALAMDWALWAERVQHDSTRPTKSAFESALITTEDDVQRMSEQQLDQYLAWYSDMFTGEDGGGRAEVKRARKRNNALQRLFPVEQAMWETSTGSGLAKSPVDAAAIQASMRPVRVLGHVDSDEEDHIDRPGSGHVRWRNVDEPVGHARAFLEAMSRYTGHSLTALVRGTFAVEKLIDNVLTK